MFVLILDYIKPIEAIDALLEEHGRYLDEHYASGHFVASGRRVPRVGGVILARAVSVDQVEAIIAKDPFVREQAARYTVIEFTPSKTVPDPWASL